MTVAVITDTAASISRRLADEWNVRLVPLAVMVAGRTYRDTEVDLASLPAARITTSGPPPGEFLAALADARDGAVIVTVAASLSSGHASARAATTAMDVPVEIVDSGTAAGAQALVVLAAAERANRGAGVAEVAEAARAAAGDVHWWVAWPTWTGWPAAAGFLAWPPRRRAGQACSSCSGSPTGPYGP